MTRRGRCSACPAPRPNNQLPHAQPTRIDVNDLLGSIAYRRPAPVSSHSSRPSLVLFGTVGAAPPIAPPCRSGRSHVHGALRQGGRHVLLSTHSPADRSARRRRTPTAAEEARTVVLRDRRAAPSSLTHAMPRAIGSAPRTTISPLRASPAGAVPAAHALPQSHQREGPEKPASYHATRTSGQQARTWKRARGLYFGTR